MNTYGVKEELLSSMSEEHKKILFNFIKTFQEVYPGVISKEEIIARINKLNYIGFETEEKKLSQDVDGEFFEGGQYSNEILISQKHRNDTAEVIKSLIYHELIHAISSHSEIDKDYNSSLPNIRTGLKRDYALFNSANTDDFIEESEILEEIMTEYYNTQLLKHEGIDLSGKHVIESFCFGRTYVEYYGTGYHSIANLGQIYDYLFGGELLKAKLVDGNSFRTQFNEIFKDTDIFYNIMEEDFVSSYSRFVNERNSIERYKTACKMFMEMLKQKYQVSGFDINTFLNSSEIELFRGMLIKTQMYDDKPTVLNKLDELMYELEFELIQSFELNDNKQKRPVNKEQIAIYRIVKELLKSSEDISIGDVNFRTFTTYTNGTRINGMILYIGGEKYLVNLDMLEFSKFNTFDEELKSQIDYLQLDDINSAEYASLYKLGGITSIITNGNEFFDYKGEEIPISPKINLLTGEPIQNEYMEQSQSQEEVSQVISSHMRR